MPTKKKIIQVVLDDSDFEKFEKLREKERRSASNLAAYIIKEWLEEHNDQSKQAGEIISMKPFA